MLRQHHTCTCIVTMKYTPAAPCGGVHVMDEDEETRGLRSRRPYERWRVKWGAVCVSVCERVFAD